MVKKKFELFDTAGWPFWCVCFLLFVAPCIYATFKITRASASPLIPVVLGVFSAALGAGVVSWAANSLLQYIIKRKRISKRKKSKK